MTAQVVIDNSVLIRARFREPNWRYVEPLVKGLREGKVVGYAPQHLLLEFLHRCVKERNRAASGRLTPDQRNRRLRRDEEWIRALRLQFLSTDYEAEFGSLRRLIGAGAGSYDAVYVHLARRLALPLCSTDRALCGLTVRGFQAIDLDAKPFLPTS